MFLTIARLCELNMKRGGNEDRYEYDYYDLYQLYNFN